MPAPERRTLLILGGTAEAAALARAAVAAFGARLDVITSLAGRTSSPAPVAGALRSGGFGGAEGLAAYLREAAVDLAIDATHPFAAQISRHARLACAAAGVPRLALLRPEWRREAGDRWIEVPDLDEAARALPALGRRVLLTIGARGLDAFAALEGIALVVRLIEAPRSALPLRAAALVIARPPFTLDGERHLLHRCAIAALVAKASGGARPAKLAAAGEAGLPVVMVARPPPEPGEWVASPAAAVAWIAARLGGTLAAGRSVMRTRGIVLMTALGLGLMASRAAAQINGNEWYTIAIAASQNKIAKVQSLLADGSNDPDAVDSQSGRTALDFAGVFDNIAMAQLLLDHGAHVNWRDSFGDVALHWAAERGSLDVMRLLIAKGATVDTANKQGITPVMVAAEHGQPDAVRLLLASGADPRKQDFTGRDAFGYADGKANVVQALNAKR